MTTIRTALVLALLAFLPLDSPLAGEEAAGDEVEQRFRRADRNGDGRLTRDELPNPRYFERLDLDGDGAVTLEEARAVLRRGNARDAAPEPKAPRPTSTWFARTEIPGLTDIEAGTNGFALADLNRDGWIDFVAAQSKPGNLLKKGPRGRPIREADRLRVLINKQGKGFEEHPLTIASERYTYEDIGRSAQIPNLIDLNGDGYLDVFLSRHSPVNAGKIRRGATGAGNTMLLSDGAWDAFREIPGALGAANEVAYNRQTAFGDVDGNGWLDLAIGCDNIGDTMGGFPHSRLYLFQPAEKGLEAGTFSDIGGTDRVPDFGGWYRDATRDRAGPDIQLADLDGDGDLDLVQSCHVDIRDPRSEFSPAEYRQGVFCWRNLLKETGTCRFEKVTGNGLAVEARLRWDETKQMLVPDGKAPGLPYLAFLDVDNDGLLDILAIGPSDPGWAPRTESVGGRLWRNRGKFRFEEATDASGLAALNWTHGQWYAFQGMEVPAHLRNWTPRYGATYPSQPGLKRTPPMDERPYWADLVVGDFDNDGWQDFIALDRRDGATRRRGRGVLFRNRGNGTFEPLPQQVSGLDAKGISGEAADLDNDGLLDVVFAADPDNSGGWRVDGQFERYRDKVFLNTGSNGAKENHWLRLRFSGVAHHELAGARVTATTGKQAFHRTVSSAHAYKSGGPMEVHFGLGSLEKVKVTVALPDGRVVHFPDLAADRYLTLDLSKRTAVPVLLTAVPDDEPAPAPAPPGKPDARRPNVLLVFTDDQGYAEVGCYGLTDIPTPRIDSLAARGVRFTDGYVSAPVCSPSRAGMLTGRYQQRFGHEHNPGKSRTAGLPLTERTMADHFKAAGYVTGLIGKWHLGMTDELHPLNRGFDEFFGFLHGGHDYLNPDRPRRMPDPILRGRKPAGEKTYLTDAFGREAVEFIRRHQKDPWFLYLSFNAVHSPLQATEEDLERFEHIEDPKRRKFAGMLHAMDRSIGLVLRELKQQGLEKDTLIFFISDNGGPTAQTTSSNAPLRGIKGQVYEGGIRIPFIVRWDGHIPPERVLRQPISALDVLPTALAAAGIVPEKLPAIDGVNLLPLLTGESEAAPHDALFWRMGDKSAVRAGDYKLVRRGDEVDLYDLGSDLAEATSLAATKPEVVKRLQSLYADWERGTVPAKWTRVGFRGKRSLEDLFKRLDANRDGKLDRTELKNQRIFRAADRDGDGFVTLEEARARDRGR